MRHIIGIVVASLLLSMPPTAIAHEPADTDTNTLVFDDAGPLLGPGGPTEGPVNELLGDADLRAQRYGGTWAPALVHSAPGHGTQAHVMTGFQCTATDPATVGSGEEALGQPYDVTIRTDAPFYHTDRDNGLLEATGSFFVPIELTGQHAPQVDALWFGFLETFAWPASSALCNGPFPPTGAYVEFYRGDSEGADGWEIPVDTLRVPDAAYGAVLRAVDTRGRTLATQFVYANVDNYLDDTEWRPDASSTCNQPPGADEPQCLYHDVTPPHPVVKGAEGNEKLGETLDACPTGVAFEYGEPLASFSVNTGTFVEYTPPARDIDPVPLRTASSGVWGPGYCVTGASGDITATAVDQSGNFGIETVSP